MHVDRTLTETQRPRKLVVTVTLAKLCILLRPAASRTQGPVGMVRWRHETGQRGAGGGAERPLAVVLP